MLLIGRVFDKYADRLIRLFVHSMKTSGDSYYTVRQDKDVVDISFFRLGNREYTQLWDQVLANMNRVIHLHVDGYVPIRVLVKEYLGQLRYLSCTMSNNSREQISRILKLPSLRFVSIRVPKHLTPQTVNAQMRDTYIDMDMVQQLILLEYTLDSSVACFTNELTREVMNVAKAHWHQTFPLPIHKDPSIVQCYNYAQSLDYQCFCDYIRAMLAPCVFISVSKRIEQEKKIVERGTRGEYYRPWARFRSVDASQSELEWGQERDGGEEGDTDWVEIESEM